MIEIKAVNVKEEDLEKAVDKDLEEFNAWVEKRLGQPVVNSERSILKTYLWYKIKENASADQPNPTEG